MKNIIVSHSLVLVLVFICQLSKFRLWYVKTCKCYVIKWNLRSLFLASVLAAKTRSPMHLSSLSLSLSYKCYLYLYIWFQPKDQEIESKGGQKKEKKYTREENKWVSRLGSRKKVGRDAWWCLWKQNVKHYVAFSGTGGIDSSSSTSTTTLVLQN